MFGIGNKRGSANKNAVEDDFPAPYGFPADHFDMPYEVTTKDAVSITPGNQDGTPQVNTFYAEIGQVPAFQQEQPGAQGDYQVAFMNAPLPSPVAASLNPAPGSVDLIEPRDTPNFAPGTNRVIHSSGPVTGVYVERYSGGRTTIGRVATGQQGPVSGGMDYAQQLSLTFQAAQFQAYSQQAAASALVSAV